MAVGRRASWDTPPLARTCFRIFPPPSEKTRDFHDLTPYTQDSKNYESVDAGEAAEEVVGNLESTDFVDSLASYDDLLKSCFAEPIVSKLKMITKISGGRVKRRLTMDCLMSGVNSISKQAARVIRPRICGSCVRRLEASGLRLFR